MDSHQTYHPPKENYKARLLAILPAHDVGDIIINLVCDDKGNWNAPAILAPTSINIESQTWTCLWNTKWLQHEVEWFKGHQDDGKEWESIEHLEKLKLSFMATLNRWCDKLAEEAWNNGCWCISLRKVDRTRKITRYLDENVLHKLYHKSLCNNISNRSIY